MTSSTRKLRAFKRWMASNDVVYSDAIHILQLHAQNICVKSKRDLKRGDIVAKIPKIACLTIRTSNSSSIIAAAGLDGCLGLCFAVMFERSLGFDSRWADYLHVLPLFEPLPFVWSLEEVDDLLCGTELHKTIKDDKALIYEDWEECILPLIHSEEFALDPSYFGVEDYFYAKSLVASRSFQIDDYHGFGMVPLADLFNHKTGAEDVHITSTTESDDDSVDETDDESGETDGENSETGDENGETDGESGETDDENGSTDEPKTQLNKGGSSAAIDDSKAEHSQDNQDNSMVLEMILIKDVKADTEVFNTYGCMGNAALLHRYGFTELDNPYDIVNIDLDLVVQWSSSLFSDRHTRSRLSLWRKLGYSGCVSQNSEYFEISYDGEPQIELLILIYIILLPEEAYTDLDLTLAMGKNSSQSSITKLSRKGQILRDEITEMRSDMLLTKSVCEALLSLGDMRENLYGTTSLDNDIQSMRKCNSITERKLYHSLVLRVSERQIIRKLRTYCKKGSKSKNGVNSRKKLKS